MKILYLHGLDSRLSDEKRKVLEQFGEVIAPDIDYREAPIMIAVLYQQFYYSNIDCIIGSSMGGFTGFYLSAYLDVPALLFNPALSFQSVEQIVPDQNYQFEKQISIVVGALDTVVLARDTQTFVARHYPSPLISIKVRDELEHQIPLSIFKEEVTQFFNSL